MDSAYFEEISWSLIEATGETLPEGENRRLCEIEEREKKEMEQEALTWKLGLDELRRIG